MAGSPRMDLKIGLKQNFLICFNEAGAGTPRMGRAVAETLPEVPELQ